MMSREVSVLTVSPPTSFAKLTVPAVSVKAPLLFARPPIVLWKSINEAPASTEIAPSPSDTAPWNVASPVVSISTSAAIAVAPLTSRSVNAVRPDVFSPMSPFRATLTPSSVKSCAPLIVLPKVIEFASEVTSTAAFERVTALLNVIALSALIETPSIAVAPVTASESSWLPAPTLSENVTFVPVNTNLPFPAAAPSIVLWKSIAAAATVMSPSARVTALWKVVLPVVSISTPAANEVAPEISSEVNASSAPAPTSFVIVTLPVPEFSVSVFAPVMVLLKRMLPTAASAESMATASPSVVAEWNVMSSSLASMFAEILMPAAPAAVRVTAPSESISAPAAMTNEPPPPPLSALRVTTASLAIVVIVLFTKIASVSILTPATSLTDTAPPRVVNPSPASCTRLSATTPASVTTFAFVISIAPPAVKLSANVTSPAAPVSSVKSLVSAAIVLLKVMSLSAAPSVSKSVAPSRVTASENVMPVPAVKEVPPVFKFSALSASTTSDPAMSPSMLRLAVMLPLPVSS